ncbi:13001_t:CDS:2 [Ambispora gerdemannii]|uniref:13001_t:CDS:1 n=1 Tax=Ambispora gerdemannii TaxID=144530 RepID=A0A9N9AGZ5_9GLOM|nr:13001_t:CDS:2 [Ambispora gerdemannii]
MNSYNRYSSIFLLVALLVFGVLSNTTTFALTIKEKRGSDNSTTETTCELIFNTKVCSACQQAIHKIRDNSDASLVDCLALYDVNTERTYDLLIKDLDATCKSPCDNKIIQNLNTQIQTDCKDELTKFLQTTTNPDNSSEDNSNSDDDGTDEIIAAGDAWMMIYSIIPLHQSICAKNSNGGGYSVIEVRTAASNYVSRLSNGEFTQAMVNFAPPDAQLSYGSAGGNQTYVTLPEDILCSNSYQKMSTPWIDYTNNNPLTVDALQTYVKGVMAPIIGNSTSLCAKSSGVAGKTSELGIMQLLLIVSLSLISYTL